MREPIYVTRPVLPPFEEYCKEIESIWDTRLLTNNGPKHKELERRLCDYLDVKNVALFTNGHLALETAIDALGLTGEIITTPFTFASTALAIVNKGLKPVFCDVEDHYYTLNADMVESVISENTSAIMPVHVYGNICDIDKIYKLAKKYKLKVIYDAAHAFGVIRDGIGVGCFGDISMFSFHATKVFHTFEGGCLTFEDSSLAEPIGLIKQFGLSGENALRIGTNAKMPEANAAMGLCNLRYVDEYIQKRKIAHTRYNERLSCMKGIILPGIQENITSNYSYYPIRIQENDFGYSRDAVFDTLLEHNIYTRKYFYPLVSSFEPLRGLFPEPNTPIAEAVANEIIALPLYADLSVGDVDYICDVIQKLKT